MTLSLRRPPRRFDLSVVLIAVLALAAGAGYRHAVVTPARTVEGLEGTVRVEVPAGWGVDRDEQRLLVHRPALGEISPTLRVERLSTADGELTPSFVDLQLARIERKRARSGMGYRVLDAEERTAFGGHESSWTHYALVRDPPGTQGGDPVMPVVVEGYDVLVTTGDGRAYHIAAWARASGPQRSGLIRNVIRSLVIASP
jgi:hypothetical protein